MSKFTIVIYKDEQLPDAWEDYCHIAGTSPSAQAIRITAIDAEEMED